MSLEAVQNAHGDCASTRCNEQGVKFALPGCPERIILKGECLLADDEGRKCDYVVLVQRAERFDVLILEHKSRRVRPSHIEEKLQQCFYFVKEHIVPKLGDANVSVCLALVAKAYGSSAEVDVLKAIRIEGRRVILCEHRASIDKIKGHFRPL